MQKHILSSSSLVGNTTADAASTSIVSIIIISFALVLSLPSLSFHPSSGSSYENDRVFFLFFLFLCALALALSLSLSSPSFIFPSILALFPISKHTALLTGSYTMEHEDERTFRVIALRRESEPADTRRLRSRHSLFSLLIQRLDRPDALFLRDDSIKGTGPISPYSRSISSFPSSLFRTAYKQTILLS